MQEVYLYSDAHTPTLWVQALEQPHPPHHPQTPNSNEFSAVSFSEIAMVSFFSFVVSQETMPNTNANNNNLCKFIIDLI